MGHIDPALMTVLITAGAGLITGLAQLCVALAGYYRSKSERAAITAKLDENTAITKDVKISTDGKMDQMLGLAKTAAFAAGQKDQVDRQTDITAAVDAASLKTPQPVEKKP
jgi:hypothetical protein